MEFEKYKGFVNYGFFLAATIPGFLELNAMGKHEPFEFLFLTLFTLSIMYSIAHFGEKFFITNAKKRNVMTGIFFSTFLGWFIPAVALTPYFLESSEFTALPGLLGLLIMLIQILILLYFFVSYPIRFFIEKYRDGPYPEFVYWIKKLKLTVISDYYYPLLAILSWSFLI